MSRLARALTRSTPDRRRVEVRLPPGFQVFERQVRDLFAARSAQLGLAAAPTVAFTDTWDKATVSIDGRPLLVVEANENLVSEVDRALLRRLSLLAGPDPVAGYLLEHGVSVAGVTAAPETARRRDGMSAAEQGELLLQRLAPDELEFEVGGRVLRRVDSADALVEQRKALFARSGVQFPDVRLVPADGDAVRLRLNHVWLPARQLDGDAGWSDAVETLRQAVDEHTHWFVRMSDVVTAIGRLSYLGPDLVAMATDRYPVTLLTACLRELVRVGESIRNLPRILWVLLEMGGGGGAGDRVRLSEAPLPGSESEVQRDPVVLAAGVRKAVAEELWRVGRTYHHRDGVRLPPSVEHALVDGTDLAAAEWQALHAVRAAGVPQAIITRSTEALRPVRDVLQALPRPPHVVASIELPPDVALRAI